MNSLILTLDAGAGCCLPIAYQQLTQGALYAAWRGSYPQLHDEGFAGDGQTLPPVHFWSAGGALPRAGQ